jgi:DNA-binding GntR family transcriptional regulator
MMENLHVDRNVASLRNQVMQRLQRAIMTGQFKPGQRLVERELCEMTGVSRPLIREVILRLEATGLLTSEAYRGYIVSPLVPEAVDDVYRVRSVLEALASRQCAERATREEKLQLRQSFERLRDAYSSSDTVNIIDQKDDFYQVLLRGAHSETTASLLRQLHVRVTLLRATTLSQPGRIQASLREIEAIVMAIESGDGDEAWKKTLYHVDKAREAALELLRNKALESENNVAKL